MGNWKFLASGILGFVARYSSGKPQTDLKQVSQQVGTLACLDLEKPALGVGWFETSGWGSLKLGNAAWAMGGVKSSNEQESVWHVMFDLAWTSIV